MFVEMNKYKVRYSLAKNGNVRTFRGTVIFSRDPDTYGNGYHMGVESEAEPFGFGSYDIRYDESFHPKHCISYIAQFFEQQYSGENNSHELVGISIDWIKD